MGSRIVNRFRVNYPVVDQSNHARMSSEIETKIRPATGSADTTEPASPLGMPADGPRLKILIVSWYFPPFNTMGALRIGTLASDLLGRGHDVRIVTGRDLAEQPTLPADFPKERVCRTPHFDIDALPKLVQRIRTSLTRKRGAARSAASGAASGKIITGGALGGNSTGALGKLLFWYHQILAFPDQRIGWYPRAVKGGHAFLGSWRPDIVFASAPPFTTLFVGRTLARRLSVPWIAEYRDRWIEDQYENLSPWRLWIERRMENRLLRGVSGLVTVSDPWADDYRKRLGKPVSVVTNGFDAAEFPAEFDRGTPDPSILRIVYTGILYGDKRDPSALFEALSRMGDKAAPVRVEFYGARRDLINRFMAPHGIEHLVEVHDRVSYRDSVRLQMQADVLLLMQWNDPREKGNVPGKLFEYIGARRPVLGLGLESGVPARLLAERGAGRVTNDPAEIARLIEGWIEEKRAKGAIPLIPAEARDGLSRADQYAGLERFFYEVLGTKA